MRYFFIKDDLLYVTTFLNKNYIQYIKIPALGILINVFIVIFATRTIFVGKVIRRVKPPQVFGLAVLICLGLWPPWDAVSRDAPMSAVLIKA